MHYQSADHLFDAAVAKTLHESHKLESRDGKCRECIGFVGQIPGPSRSWLRNERRNLSPIYAHAELLWYLSANPDIEFIEKHAKQYKRFSNNGVAYGAYGPRIMPQLRYVQRLLKKDPNTRQAVVSIYNTTDLALAETKAVNDIPCTCTWKFYIRNGALFMIADLRSQDVWLGLPYDVFVNCCIQRLLADSLNISAGPYIHQVGSLHIYERNFEAAKESITSPRSAVSPAHQPDPGKSFNSHWLVQTAWSIVDGVCKTGIWGESVDDYHRRKRLRRENNTSQEDRS